MPLTSTDIDAQLELAAGVLRSLRQDAAAVKTTTNRAVSTLSQFSATYSELISAVAALSGSTNAVDVLQAARLAKLQDEAADLFAKVSAVKAGIDALGL